PSQILQPRWPRSMRSSSRERARRRTARTRIFSDLLRSVRNIGRFARRYPDFVPAHPSATNPVLRKPPRPQGHVWLEDADAVSTVDLANAVYALLLRFLAAAYVIPASNPDKLLYVDSARGLMRALAPLAERAARLPAGPSYPGCNAGMSFTALRDAAS